VICGHCDTPLPEHGLCPNMKCLGLESPTANGVAMNRQAQQERIADRVNPTRNLETLIGAYEGAIYSTPVDEAAIERLGHAVEEEADRIGYTDHRRLMALHSAAERAVLGPPDETDW